MAFLLLHNYTDFINNTTRNFFFLMFFHHLVYNLVSKKYKITYKNLNISIFIIPFPFCSVKLTVAICLVILRLFELNSFKKSMENFISSILTSDSLSNCLCLSF